MNEYRDKVVGEKGVGGSGQGQRYIGETQPWLIHCLAPLLLLTLCPFSHLAASSVFSAAPLAARRLAHSSNLFRAGVRGKKADLGKTATPREQGDGSTTAA